jgi:hypothetical protein
MEVIQALLRNWDTGDFLFALCTTCSGFQSHRYETYLIFSHRVVIRRGGGKGE